MSFCGLEGRSIEHLFRVLLRKDDLIFVEAWALQGAIIYREGGGLPLGRSFAEDLAQRVDRLVSYDVVERNCRSPRPVRVPPPLQASGHLGQSQAWDLVVETRGVQGARARPLKEAQGVVAGARIGQDLKGERFLAQTPPHKAATWVGGVEDPL